MTDENFVPPIEPPTKEQVREMRDLFSKYYEWVYTEGDGETRGHLKDSFAHEAIKLVDSWSR